MVKTADTVDSKSAAFGRTGSIPVRGTQISRLHDRVVDMIPFDTKRPGYDLHEFFADEFACALLMPIDDILECRKFGMTPVELSSRYGVEVDVVIAWLRRLEKHPE